MVNNDRRWHEAVFPRIEISETSGEGTTFGSGLPQNLIACRTYQSLRRGCPRVFRALFAMLAATTLTVACSSGGDGHHADDGGDAAFDVAIPDDGGTDSAVDVVGDVSSDGGQNLCVPTCAATQVCCVDQHGHFPVCVNGAVCPPPAQPADGG